MIIPCRIDVMTIDGISTGGLAFSIFVVYGLGKLFLP